MCEFIHIFHSSVWLYLYSEVNLAHLHQPVFQQVHELWFADIVGTDGKEHIAIAPVCGIAIGIDFAFGGNLSYGYLQVIKALLLPFDTVDAADVIVQQFLQRAVRRRNLVAIWPSAVYSMSMTSPAITHTWLT